MHALFTSVPLVAIAEIGDKTQLLSILLAARYRTFWPIVAGIAIATTLNHGITAWAGYAFAHRFNAGLVEMLACVLFITIGLWALKPDKAEDSPECLNRYGAFTASALAFFIAEIGDKTQLATLTLAAQYQSLLLVTIGTTLGMLIANIPAILAGDRLLARLPMARIRLMAALLFIGFGAAGLVNIFI